jgi:hypothetical protein
MALANVIVLTVVLAAVVGVCFLVIRRLYGLR